MLVRYRRARDHDATTSKQRTAPKHTTMRRLQFRILRLTNIIMGTGWLDVD